MKLAICLLLLCSPLFAQFTYAPIDVPDAMATEVRGLNVHGEVAGLYHTTLCSDGNLQIPGCPSKGFKFVNGAYIKLMVPKSLSTAITGLNDNGDLVGLYTIMKTGCSQPVTHGFIWYHQNIIRTIDAPGTGSCSSFETVPMGINNAGTVVGRVIGSGTSGSFPSGGFVWVNGKFSPMDPQSPGAAGPCCGSVNGIANNGFISGSVFQSDFFMAWFKDGKDEDFYKSNPTGGDTIGTGVNSNSDVVGFSSFSGGYFAKHIELNEGTNDENEVSPSFIKVLFPGSQVTYPFSVNDLRWVGGTYVEGSDTHGFIAKPTF